MKSSLLLGLSLFASSVSTPRLSVYSEELTRILEPRVSEYRDFSVAEHQLKEIPSKSSILSQGIYEVIGGKSAINFDKKLVHDSIYNIFYQCFDLRGQQLVFLQPTPQKLQQFSQSIDNIRLAIKQQAGRAKALLLSPGNFENFLKSKSSKFYHALVKRWQLHYQGGEEQFIKDYSTIIASRQT